MPSKYRSKLNRQKIWNEINSDSMKQCARQSYIHHRETIIRNVNKRKRTDQTGAKKAALRAKNRWMNDNDYRVVQTARVKRRQSNDHMYRDKLKKSAMKCLLNDSAYTERNREAVKKRLAENKDYRDRNREGVKKRLAENKDYRDRNKERVERRMTTDSNYRNRHKECVQKRLINDVTYRDRNRQSARINTTRRLKNNETYREVNKVRAKNRYNQLHESPSSKMMRRIQAKRAWSSRQDDIEGTVKNQRKKSQTQAVLPHCIKSTGRQVLTAQQKYWIRRSRLLAVAVERRRMLAKQQKMHNESGTAILDIKLLFNRAEQFIKQGQFKIKKLHSNVVNKVTNCLDCIPADKVVTADDITTAFEGTRVHCASGEPYFWEQGYYVYPKDEPIPIDDSGQARIFEPVSIPTFINKPLPPNSQNAADEPSNVATSRPGKFWQCNQLVCKITQDLIDGTVILFKEIVNTSLEKTTAFYFHMDDCISRTHSNKMGHFPHCMTSGDCDSLLRPARTLSCHFTCLRSIVRRLYEIRQLCVYTEAVRLAMSSGNYEQLKQAVTSLNDIISRLSSATKSTNAEITEEDSNTDSHICADEEDIITKYGRALREVTRMRDNYVTQACDICEQMRSDLSPLASYTDRSGFGTEKMDEIIELLYQNKTQHEDLNEFLESTIICRYCADKLKGNKDIARNSFNRLSVIPVPTCISDLNLFEKTLIKFTMTCLTVVRLGNVTNKKRPQNELTSALKGRVAYLPVDVSANATFLPEQLLNVNSLVLLVGGQPTKNNKVWTSVVDLRKIHTALQWLRANNHLYKDVPSYSTDDIQRIIEDRVRQDNNIHQISADGSLLKRLNEASRSYLYENFTTQPLSGDFPADALIDYQLGKVSGLNANIFDSYLDVSAFPELFPTGVNGFKDAHRTVKIGVSDFIRSRLLNKDSRFRLNISYLFHCFQLQEVSNMCNSVGHMLRKVTGNSLTARQLHERLQKKDGELQSKMFSLMANLRGTKEYFSKIGMELKWMLKTIGPPTLFVTCSCAEYFSEPFLNYLRTVNHSVPGIDKMTPAELCAMDPVSVSMHFTKKWESVFSRLIKAKDTPIFGEVTNHFWRIEYQARGAPHVHCLLWIKDAPVIGKDSAEDVKRYIDSIATCAIPDSNSSPTLCNLVKKFQVHKCNKYCTKTYQKQGKFFKKCSFGFPRPVKVSTQLNDVIDCLAMNKNRQPRKRLYNLRRTKYEDHINDYNPALLLANQANVDVQYIGHVGSRLPYYITDYITKHERSEQDTLWEDIFSSTKSLGTNAMSFALQCVKNRQVGAVEAADRLLGHKLYSKSRQTRFADLQPISKAKRVLKPSSEIAQILQVDPDSEDIFQPHWVLDIYPDRPDSLEDCSLHELLSWYEREKYTDSSRSELQLKTLRYCLRRRLHSPYIVTHHVVNPNQSDEHKETYFYYLLKLFKPWRSEDDLPIEGSNFYETYVACKDNYPDMACYHERNVHRSRQDEEIEQAVRERAQQLRTEQKNEQIIEDAETANEGCATDHVQNAMRDILESHVQHINRNSNGNLSEVYNSLNEDQKRVVENVVSHVCSEGDPIRLMVSGQGGTGKSRVIDAINRIISDKLQHNPLPVIIAAPTGLSAYNIGGTTIHRVLQLPIEHLKPADYCRLSQDQLNTVRATLQHVRLLIIDEVSMISSLTLLYIHLRLTEVMANNDFFGGISVVFFGDFFQLPPVKGNQPFIKVTPFEAKQRLGSIGSIDLWSTLSYYELTINMRQRGDQQYADLLSSLRVGKVNETQLSMLSGRFIAADRRATTPEICKRFNELVAQGFNPLILMPRTALCDEINAAMLQQIGSKIYHLSAIDILDTIVNQQIMTKVEKAYRKIDDDTTRTAGLEKNLQLSVGARVMLKRNKDVEAGLVNGSVGSITGFGIKQDNGREDVVSIEIKFQHIECPVSIVRESYSFEVLKGVYYTRKQFPLMLAFAITVHKSQGLSLESAIVDAGPTTFSSGMTYVALSRVTKLTGLHLIDFDKTKVKCDQKAVEEYNRLRQLYMSHLGNILQPDSSEKKPRDSSKKSVQVIYLVEK